MTVTGGPLPAEDDLWFGYGPTGQWSGGGFGIAAGGALVYLAGAEGPPGRRLVVVDEDGAVRAWSEDRLIFTNLAVSPDGRRLAAGSGIAADDDIQLRLSELEVPRLTTFAAERGKHCELPLWAPDGLALAYSCRDETTFELFVRRVDGRGRLAPLASVGPGQALVPLRFTADGRWLLVIALAQHDQGTTASAQALSAAVAAAAGRVEAHAHDVAALRESSFASAAGVEALRSRDLEARLASCEPLVSLYLPARLGGEIESAFALVSLAIERSALVGLSVDKAQKRLARAQEVLQQGKLRDAFDELCKAYKELTGKAERPGG